MMAPVTDSGDLLQREVPLPDAVVRYDDHPDALVDLHLPDRRARGLLVLLHGGFWRAEHDHRHLRPLAGWLRDEGWLVASPEYRRAGASGARAGGWPTTAHDVRRAGEALPGLLLGLGLEVPATHLTLGHSAGGHMALWLAAQPAVRGPAEAARSGAAGHGALALAPVGDLRDAYARDLGRRRGAGPAGR